MRVRMLTTAAGAEGVWPAGAVVTVTAELGAALAAGGYALVVDEEPAPAVPAVPEPVKASRAHKGSKIEAELIVGDEREG